MMREFIMVKIWKQKRKLSKKRKLNENRGKFIIVLKMGEIYKFCGNRV